MESAFLVFIGEKDLKGVSSRMGVFGDAEMEALWLYYSNLGKISLTAGF